MTLYAWFTPERAELHYAVGTGSGSVSRDFEVVNAGDGKPMGSTATAAPGYVFEGWYDARGNLAPHGRDAAFAPIKDADDVWFTGTTWYARFAPITYTIAFEGNGADPSSPGMQDMTASYEVPAALAIVGVKFTREAYVFDGWNTAADGTGTAYADGATVVNLATVQDAVVRLYAQWRVVGYTITYDRNNDVRGTITSPPNGALHKVDEPFMLATAADTVEMWRLGYVFDGWCDAAIAMTRWCSTPLAPRSPSSSSAATRSRVTSSSTRTGRPSLTPSRSTVMCGTPTTRVMTPLRRP